MPSVQINHFADILCVWAYVGQPNLNRLVDEFGGRISVELHFCSVFPDVWRKIETQWKNRGGFDGYGQHVHEVARKFEDTPVHPDTWVKTRPRSSANPHLFVKAVGLIENEGRQPVAGVPFSERLTTRAAHELRVAFFEKAEDVSHWDIHREVAGRIGVSFDQVIAKIETGEAIAKLATDYDLGQSLKIEGSPTYVLNDGRQKLFGNVSYGVIEANVTELIAGNDAEAASLC